MKRRSAWSGGDVETEVWLEDLIERKEHTETTQRKEFIIHYYYYENVRISNVSNSNISQIFYNEQVYTADK